MIERRGWVHRVEDGQIWIRINHRSVCASCMGRCSNLLQVRHNKLIKVSVSGSNPNFKPGDRILVGLRESDFVIIALMVYLLPLAGLFSAMGLGKVLATYFGVEPKDWIVAIVAGLGLMVTFAVIHFSALPSHHANRLQVLRLDA